jgi:hypothetical protein
VNANDARSGKPERSDVGAAGQPEVPRDGAAEQSEASKLRKIRPKTGPQRSCSRLGGPSSGGRSGRQLRDAGGGRVPTRARATEREACTRRTFALGNQHDRAWTRQTLRRRNRRRERGAQTRGAGNREPRAWTRRSGFAGHCEDAVVAKTNSSRGQPGGESVRHKLMRRGATAR